MATVPSTKLRGNMSLFHHWYSSASPRTCTLGGGAFITVSRRGGVTHLLRTVCTTSSKHCPRPKAQSLLISCDIKLASQLDHRGLSIQARGVVTTCSTHRHSSAIYGLLAVTMVLYHKPVRVSRVTITDFVVMQTTGWPRLASSIFGWRRCTGTVPARTNWAQLEIQI